MTLTLFLKNYTMRLNIYIILFFIITILNSKADQNLQQVVLNDEFVSQFLKTSIIKRDKLLDNMLNSTVSGRGYIESIDYYRRYDSRFRILLASEILRLNIKFFIFTDNPKYKKNLKKGDLFEFKGKFMLYTPLNYKKDYYIFDILLED